MNARYTNFVMLAKECKKNRMSKKDIIKFLRARGADEMDIMLVGAALFARNKS